MSPRTTAVGPTKKIKHKDSRGDAQLVLTHTMIQNKKHWSNTPHILLEIFTILVTDLKFLVQKIPSILAHVGLQGRVSYYMETKCTNFCTTAWVKCQDSTNPIKYCVHFSGVVLSNIWNSPPTPAGFTHSSLYTAQIHNTVTGGWIEMTDVSVVSLGLPQSSVLYIVSLPVSLYSVHVADLSRYKQWSIYWLFPFI